MNKTRYYISQYGGVFTIDNRNDIVNRARRSPDKSQKFRILTNGIDPNNLPKEPIHNLSVFGIVQNYIDDMIDLTEQMPSDKFNAISNKWNKIQNDYVTLPPLNYDYNKAVFVNNDTIYPTLDEMNRYRFCGIDTESFNGRLEMIQLCFYNSYENSDYMILIIRRQYFNTDNFKLFYNQLMIYSNVIKVYCDAMYDIQDDIKPNKLIDVLEREGPTIDKVSLVKIVARRLGLNMNVFTTPYMSPTFSDWSAERLTMVQKWYATVDSLAVCMVAQRMNTKIESYVEYDKRYNEEERARNRLRGRR